MTCIGVVRIGVCVQVSLWRCLQVTCRFRGPGFSNDTGDIHNITALLALSRRSSQPPPGARHLQGSRIKHIHYYGQSIGTGLGWPARLAKPYLKPKRTIGQSRRFALPQCRSFTPELRPTAAGNNSLGRNDQFRPRSSDSFNLQSGETVTDLRKEGAAETRSQEIRFNNFDSSTISSSHKTFT